MVVFVVFIRRVYHLFERTWPLNKKTTTCTAVVPDYQARYYFNLVIF
jgi:hypothetical protein